VFELFFHSHIASLFQDNDDQLTINGGVELSNPRDQPIRAKFSPLGTTISPCVFVRSRNGKVRRQQDAVHAGGYHRLVILLFVVHMVHMSSGASSFYPVSAPQVARHCDIVKALASSPGSWTNMDAGLPSLASESATKWFPALPQLVEKLQK